MGNQAGARRSSSKPLLKSTARRSVPARLPSNVTTEAGGGPDAKQLLKDLLHGEFRSVHESDAITRVRLVKAGLPATVLNDLSHRLAMTKEQLFSTLGLSRATMDRKAREGTLLSQDESSRVLGMAALIGQVQAMVEQSGNPDGFDAAGWLSSWLAQPLSALGGQKPASFMDTAEGRTLIADLMARMQSGAYT